MHFTTPCRLWYKSYAFDDGQKRHACAHRCTLVHMDASPPDERLHPLTNSTVDPLTPADVGEIHHGGRRGPPKRRHGDGHPGTLSPQSNAHAVSDNFRMKYRYGRYGATYDMVALSINFRVIEQNFRCCQRIQQRQSYKLRVHGMNPQSPLMV